MWHHETDSRRSKKGFPDLVISGPGGTIFAELKAQRGKITPDQQAWIDSINNSGGECWVWRPSHWPDVLHRLRLLAQR